MFAFNSKYCVSFSVCVAFLFLYKIETDVQSVSAVSYEFRNINHCELFRLLTHPGTVSMWFKWIKHFREADHKPMGPGKLFHVYYGNYRNFQTLFLPLQITQNEFCSLIQMLNIINCQLNSLLIYRFSNKHTRLTTVVTLLLLKCRLYGNQFRNDNLCVEMKICIVMNSSEPIVFQVESYVPNKMIILESDSFLKPRFELRTSSVTKKKSRLLISIMFRRASALFQFSLGPILQHLSKKKLSNSVKYIKLILKNKPMFHSLTFIDHDYCQ